MSKVRCQQCIYGAPDHNAKNVVCIVDDNYIKQPNHTCYRAIALPARLVYSQGVKQPYKPAKQYTVYGCGQ
jgi:hypothetical protein